MTARTGLAELISQVRSMANVGTADATVNGVSFWTDDQLQSTLDRHREQIERETLAIATDYQNGTPVYTRYQWSEPNVERSTSGSAAWKIQNGAGSVYAGSAGTAAADYSVNYDAREITFNSDTNGTTYYLTYRSYDLERAAADVWEDKAAYVAAGFDVRIDNHDLKRSQLRQSYLDMAKSYKKRAKPQSAKFFREDVY